MKISVFYDVVCPWCFIGHKRLLDALKPYPADKISVEYAPFQLAPDNPREAPMETYYQQRGIDPGVMQTNHQRVVEIGKTLGITFNYANIKTMFNTLDAHRLVRIAPADKKTDVVSALFEGYFTRGLNYGRTADLAKIGAAAGMGSVEKVAGLLETKEAADAIRSDVKHAYTLPIITVPYMVVNDKWPIQFTHLEGVADFAIKNLFEG